MKFSYEGKRGKVLLRSLMLDNLFLDYTWDEETNVLDFGSGHFWASDPKMKFDLTKLIEEDIEGFKEIPVEEDGRWVDWNDIFIDRIIIEEGQRNVIMIEYAFRCGHSAKDTEGGYRLIMGYMREIEGENYSKYGGRPEGYRIHQLGEDRMGQKLVIYW